MLEIEFKFREFARFFSHVMTERRVSISSSSAARSSRYCPQKQSSCDAVDYQLRNSTHAASDNGFAVSHSFQDRHRTILETLRRQHDDCRLAIAWCKASPERCPRKSASGYRRFQIVGERPGTRDAQRPLHGRCGVGFQQRFHTFLDRKPPERQNITLVRFQNCGRMSYRCRCTAMSPAHRESDAAPNRA